MSALHRGLKAYFRLLASLASIRILLAAVVLAPIIPMWTTNNGSTFRGATELSYPYFESIIPSWACGLVAIGFPILVAALFQIKIRSWWDFQTAMVGRLKAVLFAYVSYCLISL
jgi:hypothetical protein